MNSLVSVGYISSPYGTPEEAPRQGARAKDLAEVVVRPEFSHLLDGIEERDFLIILYVFHLSRGEPRAGAFARRTPHRPNPLGLCVARLVERKGNRLLVQGMDAVDGSPVVDIKPFVREIDCPGAPD